MEARVHGRASASSRDHCYNAKKQLLTDVFSSCRTSVEQDTGTCRNETAERFVFHEAVRLCSLPKFDTMNFIVNFHFMRGLCSRLRGSLANIRGSTE